MAILEPGPALLVAKLSMKWPGSHDAIVARDVPNSTQRDVVTFFGLAQRCAGYVECKWWEARRIGSGGTVSLIPCQVELEVCLPYPPPRWHR